jgi:hypothetical protein
MFGIRIEVKRNKGKIVKKMIREGKGKRFDTSKKRREKKGKSESKLMTRTKM